MAPSPFRQYASTMEDATDRLLFEVGQELLAAAWRRRPPPLSRDWFADLGMAQVMGDERVKSAVFRFVDALPTLRSDASLVRVLDEYLEPVKARLPGWSRFGDALRRWGIVGDRRLARWIRSGAPEMAHRFLVDPHPDALSTYLEGLRDRGLTCTVDWLGEAVISEPEADAYRDAYLRLIPILAATARTWTTTGGQPAAQVSVKLSALTAWFEPADPSGTSARVRQRLRPIIAAARAHGIGVCVDMEHHGFRDATLRIFADIAQEPAVRDWPHLGIAIQAYLRRAKDDLQGLIQVARARHCPIPVRLVKGAYWDFEVATAMSRSWDIPVYTVKSHTDHAFEALTRYLLANRRWLRPAIAGHNVRSLAHAIAVRDGMGIDRTEVEFQLLHGMADPLKDALVERGERVRVYCPVGPLLPGMAYLVRRLLENTSNTGFVRSGFLEHRSMRDLLAPPMGESRSSSWQRISGQVLPQPMHTAVIAAVDSVSEQPRGVPMPAFANHPIADFSREADRRAMAEALARLAPLGDRPSLIGGVPMTTGTWIESRNPSHRTRVLGRVPAGDAATATAAIDAAAAAMPAWRATSWTDRIRCLMQAAQQLADRRWELSAALVAEVGKPWREADAEVCEAIDLFRYYALQAQQLATPPAMDAPGETNDTVYEPRGVAVAIAPWNFPLAILGGMAAAALVTGNPVVLKPAEQAPLIADRLYQILIAAGVPAGAINLLHGDGEAMGPALVDHPATALIAFTGSRAVGAWLQERCARPVAGRQHLVKLVAELGGKNAILIDETADLDEAIAGTIASAFGYAGQKCSACSRVIVHRSVHRECTERLVAAVRDLPIGPAEDPGHPMPPVIDDAARERLERQLAELKRGAGMQHSAGMPGHRCVYAGDVAALVGEGSYVAPHVFDAVDPASPLAQDELFGPVLAVIPADDLTQMLAIANGTAYALTGGCYSRSPATLERVRREFRVGNLYLNRGITGALVNRQPFGGFAWSGTGTKAGGADYLRHFCVPRTITENTIRHGMVGDR